MKKLHPNAKALFYLSGVMLFVFLNLLFVTPGLIALAVDSSMGFGVIFGEFSIALIISLILPIPFAHLSYENFKYEVQKDRVYIEKGTIWKSYISIPFDRVQNVDIYRGPLARMLELSDLHIQTAGASARQTLTEGRIPGISVEEANQLRNQILSRISDKKQGL